MKIKTRIINILHSQPFMAGTLLLLLIGLLVDPFHFDDQNSFYIVFVWLAVLIYCLLVLFVYKENPEDEREMHNRFYSSRAAYLSGSAFLMFVCMIQGSTDTIDPWILLTLIVMIFSKLIAHIYIEYHDK